MRFFIGNTSYLFTIAQGGNGGNATDGFHIEFQYRRLQESSPQALGTEEKRFLHVPNDQQLGYVAELLMGDVLQGFQVPENIRADMSVHFKFHLFGSRLYRGGGSFNVVVRLEVREYTAERAAMIQRRMESTRREREREREQGRRGVVEREVLPSQPTNKRVVERLEREVVAVVDGDGDGDECSICLGKTGVGVEVMKLPCLHVYHTNCIIKWLERTHYCPYCRFELPC